MANIFLFFVVKMNFVWALCTHRLKAINIAFTSLGLSRTFEIQHLNKPRKKKTKFAKVSEEGKTKKRVSQLLNGISSESEREKEMESKRVREARFT